MATNLFARAEASAKNAKCQKPETVWNVRDYPNSDKAGLAIAQLHKLTADAKAHERKADECKATLKSFVEGIFLEECAERGGIPDGTMKLVNGEGLAATYVVQDCSASSALKDSQVEQLAEVLGADVAEECVYTLKVFKFDAEVMASPTANSRPAKGRAPRLVQDAVAEAVSEALVNLQRKGVLSQEQLEGLVNCEQKRVLRPGVLDRLTELCDCSVATMRAFLDAVGSASKRFVKAG